MKTNFKHITLSVFMLFLVLDLFAQGGSGPPPPDGEDGVPGTVDDVPLNFLIYPLMVLGVYLGVRLSRKNSK